MKTGDMATVLDDLKDALLPLVGELSERAASVDDSFLRKRFPADEQRPWSAGCSGSSRCPATPGASTRPPTRSR